MFIIPKLRVSDIKKKKFRREVLRGTQIQICGPIDASTAWFRGGLRLRDVEKVFRAISGSSNLRGIWVEPNYYSDHCDGMLSTSLLCCLLSNATNLQTLAVVTGGLGVMNQEEVEQLAAAFEKCTSLQNIAIDQLVVGYENVNSLLPLMTALANLPNIDKLELVIDAFGEAEHAERYAQDALPVLQASPGLSDFDLKRLPYKVRRIALRFKARLSYRELSNCDYTEFYNIRYGGHASDTDDESENNDE